MPLGRASGRFRVTLKSPRLAADPAHMLGTSVSSNVWIGTALIAAITVFSCLGFICTRLGYELELIRVVASVKKLRNKLSQQLHEAGAQAAEQPSPVAWGAGSVDSSTPTPDSAGSAGNEEIPEIQPDPESAPLTAADAA